MKQKAQEFLARGLQQPQTNVEGLALLWRIIYPAELARQLSALTPEKPLSRAGAAKWREVPTGRVLDVSTVTGIPKSYLLPELFAET